MKKLILLLILLNNFSFTQNNDERFSVFIGGNYITSAQIFLNPNSSDLIIRNESFEITDLFAPSFDIRYRLTDDVLIGAATEYISSTNKLTLLIPESGSGRMLAFETDDGVIFIPIEFSAYYLMPFSTESFSFTMGGGIGYYIGSHTRILGDTEIENINKKNTFALLVSLGMEYRVYKQFGLRFDMKFRDPENKITSKYKSATFNYKDRENLTIINNEFDSKVNLNGVSFLLGLTFHF